MIDHNGNLLNQITYNSKGEIVNQTSPTVSFRFAYTGREFDISTGLYYNRARYYDPIEEMIMFYCLEPEVSGHIGDSAIIDYSVHPPIVSQLHYEFDGWLGDDLIEAFPCYLVSQRLKEALDASNFTGFKFDEVKISKSSEFLELYQERCLPKFYWFKIIGIIDKDDVSLSKNYQLIVSQKFLDFLKKYQIKNADIEEFIIFND